MRPRRFLWTVVKTTVSDWWDDKAPRLGAALAFYSVFSLAPLLLIALAIAGLLFPAEAGRREVLVQVSSLIGQRAAEGVAALLDAADEPAEGQLAAALGVIALIFGASGVFGQLQDALNTIWEVQPKPGLSIASMIRDRFLSFVMVLGTGFLLLVSLLLSAGLSAAGVWLAGRLPLSGEVMQMVNVTASFAVITVLFALIFKYVPDARIGWGDVWLGALVTSALFAAGKLLIGFYLGRSAVASAYGAAGSLVLILLWVYYAAQILFLGAEFTQAYAKLSGSHVQPAEHAIAVTEERRAQEGLATAAEERPQAAAASPPSSNVPP